MKSQVISVKIRVIYFNTFTGRQIKLLTLCCFILSGVCRRTGRRVVLNVSSPPWSLDLCDCEPVFVCVGSADTAWSLTGSWLIWEKQAASGCAEDVLSSNKSLLCEEDAELNPECCRVQLWGHSEGLHVVNRRQSDWGGRTDCFNISWRRKNLRCLCLLVCVAEFKSRGIWTVQRAFITCFYYFMH